MLRLVLAMLLCLGTAGCGAPVFPSEGGAAAARATDFIALGSTALAVTVLAAFLLWRGRRAAGEGKPRPRLLLSALVVSVAGAGFLTIAYDLLSESNPIEHASLASLAAIAWAALLLVQFRSALDARRWVVVARIGAFLAVVQVPVWVIAVWVEPAGVLLGRLAWTLALLAAAGAHAIYLTKVPLRIEQRWLVNATLGAATPLVGLGLVVLATNAALPAFGAFACRVLLVTVAMGTVLVVACRRLDPAPVADTEASLDPAKSRP